MTILYHWLGTTGVTVANGAGNIIPDPYTFGWGTTIVTYTVTDKLGLSTSCSFEVKVIQCGLEGPTVHTPRASTVARTEQPVMERNHGEAMPLLKNCWNKVI